MCFLLTIVIQLLKIVLKQLGYYLELNNYSIEYFDCKTSGSNILFS